MYMYKLKEFSLNNLFLFLEKERFELSKDNQSLKA